MGNVCIDDAETHECQVKEQSSVNTVRNLYLNVASERLHALTPQALALSLYKRFNQHIVSDSKHLQKQQLAFPIMSRCHSCSLGTEPLPVSTGVWHGAVCIHLGTLGYGCNMSQHLL